MLMSVADLLWGFVVTITLGLPLALLVRRVRQANRSRVERARRYRARLRATADAQRGPASYPVRILP